LKIAPVRPPGWEGLSACTRDGDFKLCELVSY
jgi:hypothetical protein